MSATAPEAQGLKRTDIQEHDLSVPGRQFIQPNRVARLHERPRVGLGSDAQLCTEHETTPHAGRVRQVGDTARCDRRRIYARDGSASRTPRLAGDQRFAPEKRAQRFESVIVGLPRKRACEAAPRPGLNRS